MMTLSTKGRYAARIMVYLALHEKTGPITKYQIAEAEEISPDYTEQIMVRLKAGGLAISRRGRHGGFMVARDPETISMSDILSAVEGPIRPVPCIDKYCERQTTCPTRPVWMKAVAALDDLFGKTSLAQMVEQTRAQQEINYHI